MFRIHAVLLNERKLAAAVAVRILIFVARTWATAGGRLEQQMIPLPVVTVNGVALLALNSEVTDLEGIFRDFAYSAL